MQTVLSAALIAALLSLMPAGPAQAAFPGTNGKIGFRSDRNGNGEIYVMDADGSDQTRLTTNTEDDERPAWSPDGSQTVFESFRDGNGEIYVMNADGSGQTRLTTDAADDRLPAWSPDGTLFAFSSTRDLDFEIYVMDANGSNQTNLSNNAATDAEPAWSPDGTLIAFSSDRDGSYQLYVMNADGSNQTRLTSNGVSDISPDWSPDGTRIVFRSRRDTPNLEGNGEIYVMDADGSNQTRLTSNGSDEIQPAWSPDGTRIAFASDRDGYFEIYVMNADGSDQTRLTSNAAQDLEPDWQPVLAPANDNQNQALGVGEGQYPGVLALATADGTSSCAGNGEPDIWYLFTAPMAGVLRADTCGTNDLGGVDSGTDTVLSLHSGDGLTELACNDDWPDSNVPLCSADTGTLDDSYVEASVVQGQQVLIRVTKFPLSPASNILLNVAFEPDVQPDSDQDGVPDSSDNCTQIANPTQCDSNGDGFGNRCDADLNNNSFTNAQDYVLFRAELGQPSVAPTYNPADFNCNGFVNAQDYVLFRGLLGSPPGPGAPIP